MRHWSLLLVLTCVSHACLFRSEKIDPEQDQCPAVDSPTTVQAYLEQHSHFPLIVLCHNRPKQLRRTLHRLQDANGIDLSLVVVIQDGFDPSVAATVSELNVSLIQRDPNETPTHNGWSRSNSRKHIETAGRIANHFKYAFDTAFEMFDSTPSIIVVEDDLEVSPDFVDFFVSAAPSVERDPSLWSASAWNDNGFIETVSHNDKTQVQRTDFFPGLGWLLMRSLWVEELRFSWPSSHWDWYMRDPAVSKGRATLIPQIPRVAHRSNLRDEEEGGTFSDNTVQHRYFDRMAINLNKHVVWSQSMLRATEEPVYSQRFLRLLMHGSIHIRHGKELSGPLTYFPGLTLVCWYFANPDPRFESKFKPLAKRFGIWHQQLRGSWKGVHQFRYRSVDVVLINTFDPASLPNNGRRKKTVWFHGAAHVSPWVSVRPPTARVFASGRQLVDEMDT